MCHFGVETQVYDSTDRNPVNCTSLSACAKLYKTSSVLDTSPSPECFGGFIVTHALHLKELFWSLPTVRLVHT